MTAPTTTLTGRQRVNRVFRREDQDRVPRFEHFWPDTIERWQAEGLQGGRQEVLRALDSDIGQLGPQWPAPFPGQRETLSEDEQTEVVRTAWGGAHRYWKERSGTPEHINFGCDSREAWEKHYKPVYADYPVNINEAGLLENYQASRQADQFVCLNALESFEAMRQMIGDEICLMAMAEDPDWIAEVSRYFTDAMLKQLQAQYDLGLEADGLWIYGDMAFNHATMCSPRMYRELVWPDHKRLADWAHERGMWVIYHTDGNVNGVIDLYLEAGFDCLQPLEAKAGMDVRELAPKWGDRLALFGNIDVMVMAQNDPDALEDEISAKLEAGKATRGYIYHSDHSVPPSVSWDTYQHLISLLDKYGQYH